jgi:hypothetical protein
VFADQIDFAPPAAAEVPAEPRQSRSGKEATGKRKEENIFDEVGAEEPAAGPGGRPETGRTPASAPSAAREGSQAKPLFTDFEPREYMPPKDEFEPAEQKAGVNQGASRPSKASKRETIVRLETWLKNIKKET